MSGGFWHGADTAVGKMLAPSAPATPGYERSLLGVANQARGMASAFVPVVQQRMRDLTDTTDEEKRARGLGAVDLAQQMGTQQYSENDASSTPFARALMRAKALSRISQQGELQAQNQAIQSRFSMARLGNNVRNGVASDMSNLAAGQAEANASAMRGQQMQSASYANAFGSLAGAAGSYFRNSMSKK